MHYYQEIEYIFTKQKAALLSATSYEISDCFDTMTYRVKYGQLL